MVGHDVSNPARFWDKLVLGSDALLNLLIGSHRNPLTRRLLDQFLKRP
jgi:hypothetical protein